MDTIIASFKKLDVDDKDENSVELLNQSVFQELSDTSDNLSTNEEKAIIYGNQGHGKLFEKHIGLYMFHINISKYINTSKYDIEFVDNNINHKNISIKSTKSNIIYCGDVFNFMASDNCDMIIVFYKQNSDYKEIVKLCSLNIDEYLKILAYSKFEKLQEYKSYINNQKEYFQRNYDNEVFDDFRKQCKTMSKELSTDLLRINAKISTPKMKMTKTNNDKSYICDNFRIQCSINLKKLIKHNIMVNDISHELMVNNIPTKIHSSVRKINRK
tara:strand:- start:131 stop:943 length:813 start_codon:yes stop_codon:yes gene_type:complete